MVNPTDRPENFAIVGQLALTSVTRTVKGIPVVAL
jgi:hypothetical protein